GRVIASDRIGLIIADPGSEQWAPRVAFGNIGGRSQASDPPLHHVCALSRSRLWLAHIAPRQKTLMWATVVGPLRGDASRYQDGRRLVRLGLRVESSYSRLLPAPSTRRRRRLRRVDSPGPVDRCIVRLAGELTRKSRSFQEHLHEHP